MSLYLWEKLEEPYDGRLSRTVLREAWGEIPLAYSIINVVANNKETMCKIRYLLISTFLILLSCKENINNSAFKIEKVSDSDPFKNTIVKSEHYSINPSIENVIESNKGYLVILPSDGFLDKKGNVVTDSIDIELAIASDISDYILSNLMLADTQYYYDLYASFFINATKEGQQLSINPNNPIYIELPVDNKLSLFKCNRDNQGNMSQISELEAVDYLTCIPLDLLDFLPPGFEIAVEKGLPIKNYSYSTKELLDSLFYSFSTPVFPRERNVIYGQLCMISFINPIYKLLAQEDAEVITETVDSAVSICGINPASIKAIKSKKFNNTLIATREFETRLKSIYATCDNIVLEFYINNLNKNLWEIDQMVAEYLSPSHKQYKAFINFSSYKQTNVNISEKDALILSKYYAKKKRKIEGELQILKQEIQKKERLEQQIAIEKRKEYGKLLQARQKYRMNKFGFKLTEFGWYNGTTKTPISIVDTFSLNVSIDNGNEFERSYTYVINPKINSIFSLLSENKINFNKAFSYDPILLLWKKQAFDIIGVGYNGNDIGFKLANTTQDSVVNVNLILDSCNIKSFKQKLKKYTKGYTKENQIAVDLEYQAFFHKEKIKREQEIEEFLFQFALRQVVFPCCKQDWNQDELTARDLMELYEE